MARSAGFNGPSKKAYGCFNCDHYQDYGIIEEEPPQFGECRAHPPKRCCPDMSPPLNNFPQLDQAGAGNNAPGTRQSFWCDEWKRTTKTPFDQYVVPPQHP